MLLQKTGLEMSIRDKNSVLPLYPLLQAGKMIASSNLYIRRRGIKPDTREGDRTSTRHALKLNIRPQEVAQ